MRTDLARLRVDQTVGEALAALRQSPPPARIVYFYVVDDEDRLKGVIPARSLLLSPPEARVADIMLRQVIAIPAGATVLDACEFFVLHRFLAFPVVDAKRRLLGAIDVELYTDELHDLGRQAPADDLFQLIGVHLARARQRNPFGAFRTRFPVADVQHHGRNRGRAALRPLSGSTRTSRGAGAVHSGRAWRWPRA